MKKGPNLSGVDPQTGQLTPLFHPRKDIWERHFGATRASGANPGIAIRGLTPVGRATSYVLGFNEEMRRMLRSELWLEGLYQTEMEAP